MITLPKQLFYKSAFKIITFRFSGSGHAEAALDTDEAADILTEQVHINTCIINKGERGEESRGDVK